MMLRLSSDLLEPSLCFSYGLGIVCVCVWALLLPNGLTGGDLRQLLHDLLGELHHQAPGHHPLAVLQPGLVEDPLPHLTTLTQLME